MFCCCDCYPRLNASNLNKPLRFYNTVVSVADVILQTYSVANLYCYVKFFI